MLRHTFASWQLPLEPFPLQFAQEFGTTLLAAAGAVVASRPTAIPSVRVLGSSTYIHYKNDLWPRRTSGTRRHPRHRDYAHRHGRPCPRCSAKRETSWKIFITAESVTHLSDVIRQCVYSCLQGTRVSPLLSCRSIAFPATKVNDMKAEA